MSYHQVSIGQHLSNRKPQSSSGSNLTKTARICLLNTKSKIPEDFPELKKLYIITIPNQGSQHIPVSLTIHLKSYTSSDKTEMGTFAFLQQPSQNVRPLDAFELYSISKEGLSFIFIGLKQGCYFSQINIDADSIKPCFSFIQIEFPSSCFKTPDKFTRYFDAISESILLKKFCPQDCIYSIKTDNPYIFKEQELEQTLISLQQKNQNKKLAYIINYNNSPSQRSTEDNSSEEERRTPQNKDKYQNYNRSGHHETVNEPRLSNQEPRGRAITRNECAIPTKTGAVNVHQGNGSSSSNAHQIRPKPPERGPERWSEGVNIRTNAIRNVILSQDSQEILKRAKPYQNKELPSPLDRPDSRGNRFSNPDNHQRYNSYDKHNSGSNQKSSQDNHPYRAQAQDQTCHLRGNSEPRTNKVEQSGASIVNKHVLNILQQKSLPVGLRNIGNSCFMNAILEALRMSPEFSDYIMTREYVKDKRNREKEGVADIFAKVLASLKNPNQQAFSFGELKKLETFVGKTNPTFLLYGQHDAYEFFKGLLEGISTELNRVTNPIPYKALKVDLRLPLQTSSDEWFNYLNKRENSIVSDLFCGQLMNETICLQCLHRKVAFEPYWDLSLSFQKTSKPDQKQHLDDMLQHFLGPHDITDLTFCDGCHRETRVQIRHEIWRLPKILVFHLRRFEGGNGIYRKLNTEIVFPVRNLNMSSFAKESQDKSVKSARYSLFSIVKHHGKNLTSGHYTAKCLNPEDKEWYRFDDSVVDESRIDFNVSSSHEACMLFYAKI